MEVTANIKKRKNVLAKKFHILSHLGVRVLDSNKGGLVMNAVE